MDLLRKLRAIFTRDELVSFAWLMLALLVMGLFEVVGIASIMPFMQLISQPDAIAENEWLQWAYDTFGFQDERSFLFATGVGVLLLMAMSNAMAVLVNWMQHSLVWKNAHSLSVRLLKTYMNQPYEFFLTRNSSDMSKQILSEVKELARAMMLPMLQFIGKLFVALVIFGLLFVVDAKLSTIILVVFGVVYAGIFLTIRPMLSRLGAKRFAANRFRFKSTVEAFGNIKIIKTRGCEGYFLKRFSAASRRVSRVMPRFQIIRFAPTSFVQTVAFGGILVIVLYLLSTRDDFQNVVPLLSLYALAGYRLMPAFKELFSAMGTIRYHMPVIDEVYNDLQMMTPLRRSGSKNERPFSFTAEIALYDVAFRYGASEQPVLDGVSLRIPKNASVAFVGPTGSGKTTLVDIICGLLSPTEGVVLIDDVPLTPENAQRWQSKIGYVPQEVLLYDDTIAKNIAFGVPDEEIDLERVRRAAQMAHIHEFIGELEDGYDTGVGERGARLSGGQRQRLGLARALYHEPDVLVLDEATSSLDGITEVAVMEAIEEMSQKMTIITIAHRLGTVKDCDRIFLLDEGRIVDEGSYDELIAGNTVFRDMARTAV